MTRMDRIKVASISFLGFGLACLVGWVGLDIFHHSSIILRIASMAFFISALSTLVVTVIVLASLFAPGTTEDVGDHVSGWADQLD